MHNSSKIAPLDRWRLIDRARPAAIAAAVIAGLSLSSSGAARADDGPVDAATRVEARTGVEATTRADSLFDRLNRNGDGRLTRGEIPSDRRRVFQRLLRTSDSNADGALTRREFEAATTPQQPAKNLEKKQSSEFPGANALRVLIHQMDRDKDYVITAEEVPSQLRSPFENMLRVADGDRDRRLDRAELARGGPRLSRMAQRAAERLDINVDREIRNVPTNLLQPPVTDRARRPAEFLRNPEQRAMLFARLDANRDDRLTLDELPEQAKRRFARLLRAADRDRDGSVSKRELEAFARRRTPRR